MQKLLSTAVLLLTILAIGGIKTASAASLLKNICRVKGQEENTLQGLGLVVGLKGTGDGNFLPATRSLARLMEVMGNPVGRGGPLELKDAKNIALVMVTATVPAAGGRQGDELDCTVASIGGAKSLAGGQLFLTPLQGPQVQNPRVYAFAQGAIHLDSLEIPTNGKVHGGCRLEEDFFNPFVKDGKFTLVLQKNHSDFEVAQAVADLVNKELSFENPGGISAKAINQGNIEVVIPPRHLEDPVYFISLVMSLPILEPRTEARVVINQRAGSIVIGGDVEIGAVIVAHQNVTVETTPDPSMKRFTAFDPSEAEPAKLKGLVEALNAVKVPTEDVIEIIKQIDRNGKLYATLIIE